jgi:PLP dependent protein
MSSIAENLSVVRSRVGQAALRAGRDPAEVRLIGASKGVPPARVAEAIDAGLHDFGENFIQEAAQRIRAVKGGPEVRWHFIGHLQTNKVPLALDLFYMVQSVDSLRLAQQLSRRAMGPLRVLLEVNVTGEASKYGFAPGEVAASVEQIACLPNLELDGLMTIAPAVSDAEDVRPVFRELRRLAEANGLSQLSMGMTDDLEVAVEEGATMVRVGRAIFGERVR